MERLELNLGIEKAEKYYLELCNIFQKFIQNDKDVYNYLNAFDWEKVEEINARSYEARERELDHEVQVSEELQKNITEYVKNNIEKFGELESLDEMDIEIEIEALKMIALQKDIKALFNTLECIDIYQNHDIEEIKKTIRDNRQKQNEKKINEAIFRICFLNRVSLTEDSALICDYYFKYNNRLFTLDMTRDFESLGYNKEYYLEKYGNSFKNMYCCQLCEYFEYIENKNERINMNFVYDGENKQVVDINYIYKYSLPQIEKPNVRKLIDEEQLSKILLKNIL